MVADDSLEGPQLPEKTLIGWSLSPEKENRTALYFFLRNLDPFFSGHDLGETTFNASNTWQFLATLGTTASVSPA